jgi:ribulose-5-phosphate 4-epimerase/fuculose-1-phosphate aldolase
MIPASTTSTTTTPAGGPRTERELRIDLAACYRLVAHFGWDDLVFTHISARVPGTEDAFLINPYGMLFEEITASSLVKVDARGEKLAPSDWPINPAGFVIHSAVHAARHDVQCVLHVHTNAGVAVSAQEAGLLPISQIATIALASLGYHDYEGIALRDDEKPRLVADLGRHAALILRNHGLLTVGATVADAFLAMYSLERACEVQLLAQAGGGALRLVDARILSGVKASAEAVTKGLGGGIAWPALLRKLDRLDPSYED